MGTRVEQSGEFLPCAGRARRCHLEDMADSLHRLPSAAEELQVIISRSNRALLLQGEFRITLLVCASSLMADHEARPRSRAAAVDRRAPIPGAYPGSSPRQRAGRNETPAGTRLPLLLGGADQHLIDCHVPRPGNDVGDVRDVFGCHPLPELGSYDVDHLGPVMAGQLRRDGARLRLWSARRGEFREFVATCMRADYSWARRPGLPGYLRVHPAQVSL